MPTTTQELVDQLGKQSLSGTPIDSVQLSFRGMGLTYLYKYLLSSLYSGQETVDFSNNQIPEFDVDYTYAAVTLITLDMSDNPATDVLDSTTSFSTLTLMKELYMRNMQLPNLASALAAILPSFSALEKLDFTTGKLVLFFDPSTTMTVLNYLSVRGNELPNTEIQTLLQRMTVLLGTTNVMNGTLDLRGTYAFPQSPTWFNNYGGFTGAFSAGDLIDIRDIGNTVIAKGKILTFGGGQVTWETLWLSPTVPGTFTGADNIFNNSQAGTITLSGGISNFSGYIGTLTGTYNWNVLLDVF